MPGSVQAVKYKKKYMKATEINKTIGKAGAASKFYLATKIQKGTITKREQK